MRSEPEPDSPWDDDESLETPLVRDRNVESELNLGPSFLTTSLPAAEQKEKRGFGFGALAATLLLGVGVGLVGGYSATTTLWPSPSAADPPRASSAATGRAADREAGARKQVGDRGAGAATACRRDAETDSRRAR